MKTHEIERFSGIIQTREKIEDYKRFWNEKSGYLLLAGENGLGKTYIAKAFYNTMIYPLIAPEKNWDLAFFANQADLNMLWNSYNNKFHDPMSLLESIRDSKLLIIDDLGTRAPSEAFHDFLYSLLDYRYEHRYRLGTIITTNLTSEGISNKFSTALLSRISSGIVHTFQGQKDRRHTKF